MLDFIKENKLLVIGIHMVIGYAATFSFFRSPYAYLVLAIAIGVVVFSQNKNEEAFFMAAFLVGVEVFLRMIRAAPLFEIGKYSVIVLLALGLILGPTRQKLTIVYVLYLLLLSLGIVLTEVPEGQSLRKSIVFNLSGPFMLGVCAIYFYKRRITLDQLYDALFMALLPIFSMITYMYFRTPDLKEIVFGGVSLGETSGGFGPNQVATTIGFGVFIVALYILTKRKLTGYIFFDALILAYFTYRGLLTFSRGGIITGAVAMVVLAFFYFLHKRSFKKIAQFVAISSIFVLGIWLYTSDITGGMIYNRYTGRNASGIKKQDASSGRLKLITTQFEGFQNAPLFGIGVGNGKYQRQLRGEHTAASHNEVTRLFEEHGVIGLIMFLILITVPLSHFYKSNNFRRGFLVAFFIFWFLTINHSAMRVAFPGFIYGLSLLNIKLEDE